MPRLMCGAQRKYKVREATQEVKRVFSWWEQSLAGFKHGSVCSALMRLGNVSILQVFLVRR